MRDYVEIPELADVYLEDNWVLAVRETAGSLMFDTEIVLTEQDPRHAPPKPDEQYCYLHGCLVFADVS